MDSPPIPDKRAVFRRLMGMLRPYRGMIFIALVLLVLSMPCELFPAMVWKYVVDDLILSNISHPTPVLPRWFSFNGAIHSKYVLLISALLWLFAVYAVGELLGTLSNTVLNWTGQKFVRVLRNRVYHKLQSQTLEYLQRQRTGDLMSRAMGDVDELQSFVVNGIDVIIGDGTLWVATVVIVVAIDWRVALASLTPLLVVYLMLRIFNRRVQPIYKAARDRAGDVSTRLQENLSGVFVIKIFGREKEESERFERSTGDFYDQQIKAINARNVYFPFSRAVGFLSNIGMIGFGGYLILKNPHGSFTVGSLVLLRAYWWRLFSPVQTLARVNDMVQRASASGRRVYEVLDAPDEMPDAPGAMPMEKMIGAIELRDVSFRYRTETSGPVQPIVLRNVNLRIEPGQTVALCGPSGAGKSTLLNLLPRFYDPIQGQVLADGRDVRMIQRESLRRHFALVQQETFLFNDSVLDNIRYGHPEATMEQVTAAAQAANAHEFIVKLPSGYQTKVGERGVRLSGGQKQRISIARAFLANPSVLLLDEPTSNVEPDSEAAIIAALDRLMAGRTTVLTSHRPSLILQADVAYVIEDGRIVEEGKPGDLVNNGGWFEKFIRSTEEAIN